MSTLTTFFGGLVMVFVYARLSCLLRGRRGLVRFTIVNMGTRRQAFFVPRFFDVITFPFHLINIAIFHHSCSLICQTTRVTTGTFRVCVPTCQGHCSHGRRACNGCRSFRFSLSFFGVFVLPSLSDIVDVASSSFEYLSFEVTFVLSLSMLRSTGSILVVLPSLVAVRKERLFKMFVFDSLFITN